MRKDGSVMYYGRLVFIPYPFTILPYCPSFPPESFQHQDLTGNYNFSYMTPCLLACFSERQTPRWHFLNGIRICEKGVLFDNTRNGISQKYLFREILWREECFQTRRTLYICLEIRWESGAWAPRHTADGHRLPDPRVRCTNISHLCITLNKHVQAVFSHILSATVHLMC